MYNYNNNNMNYNTNLLNYNQANLYNYNGINYAYQGGFYLAPNNMSNNYYYNQGYNYNSYDYNQNNNYENNSFKKEKEDNNYTNLRNIPLLQSAKPYYPKSMRKEKDKANEKEKEKENDDKKDDNNIETAKKEKETIEDKNKSLNKDNEEKNNEENNIINENDEDKEDNEENKMDKEVIKEEKEDSDDNKPKEEINKELKQNEEENEKIEEISDKEEDKEIEKEKENKDDLDDWANMSVDSSSEDEEEKNNKNDTNEETINNAQPEKINKEEIKQLLNEISFNLYHEPKNKLKILLNNNILNQDFFIDTIYQLSIKQLNFQQIYSNLFKDIYHYLSLNKNELKFFRKKLILKCKQNLTNKKICRTNQKLINDNLALIGELINSKIFPKKMGLRCLHYLLNKFDKYSNKNNNEIKYIYLECIIILLNKICSYIYNYQKERTHPEFDEEINSIINKLKQIKSEEKNKDMPKYTERLLQNVIEKADKKWELALYEKKNFESGLEIINKGGNEIIDENNNKSFNDSSFIKEEEYDKSFVEDEKEENKEDKNDEGNVNKDKKIIIDDGIEIEDDKKIYKNNYKTNSTYTSKYSYNKDYNKVNEWRNGDDDFSRSSSTLTYNKKRNDFSNNSNTNISNLSNNNINYKYYNNTNRVNNNNNYYHKHNSYSNNNLYNPKYSKGNYDNNSTNNGDNTSINNNHRIVFNNLKQYKKHYDNNNLKNFKWDDIDNLIIKSRIGMNEFVEVLVDSCKSFNINNKSAYYIDLYIKSIFEYYKGCLDENDITDIRNTTMEKLENLYSSQNMDYYLENIWIILIYYLINNQILSISDFNIFNKNTFSIKKSIANILSKIIDYNRESKKYFISDLKATKFFNENRNLFNIY